MTKKRKIGIIIVSVLIVLTLGFIWANSLLDMSRSAQESGFVYNATMNVVEAVAGKPSADALRGVISISVFRDMAHGFEFALLGVEIFILYVLVKRYSYIRIFEILCLGLLVAGIDECLQMLSDRVASFADVMIDFLGFVLAVGLSVLIKFLFDLKKKRTGNAKEILEEEKN